MGGCRTVGVVLGGSEGVVGVVVVGGGVGQQGWWWGDSEDEDGGTEMTPELYMIIIHV